MKKLFLIPLLTLVCSVMAWGVDVADKDALQAAVPATGSVEITLTGDISTDATALTVPEGVTVTLNLNNHSITVENTPVDMMDAWNNGLDAIVVAEGGTLTVNGAGAITCHFISTDYFSFDGGRAITSNGTLTLIGDVDITGGTIGALNAQTSTVNIGTDFTGTVTGGLVLPLSCVSGGYWTSNPQMNLVSGYGTEEVDGLFHVIESDVVYVAMNQFKEVSYETLEAAINAAEDGDYIILLADAPATVVSKEIGIDANGFDYSLITAGEGYVYEDEVDEDWNIAMRSFYTKAHNAGYQLRDFLEQEEDGSYVLTEDADISNIFGINVVGNKTLTIPADKKILYQRQWDDANIVISAGAKLTVLGSGTFQPVMHSETNTVNGFTAEISSTAGNQIGNRAIDVDGELIVGVKDDASNCPHFITSSLLRGSAITVNPTGIATLNNVDINAAFAIIWNDGRLTINGGNYVSHSSKDNGVQSGTWSYGLRCGGSSSITTINGGHFVGTQGAVAVYADAIADINGGSFETVYGYNYKTGEANTKDNHYALYVARLAIVNVYGGDFKVQTPNAGSNNVVLSGNDDAYNTYGVINIYGGRYQKKAAVSSKKNNDSAYPSSVPATSQWYSSFGSLAPLPAGYEYYETSDATYPWGVRAIPGADVAEVESNEPTIPWQRNTTWDADWSGGDDVVPEDNTIVTIPVGKTVVVDKNESETDAVAQQVFIAQGATLKVEEGTTLTVGDGGMNIGNGGQIVVEAGATVKIGAAGVITTEEEALVIESSEEIQGTLIYDPAVSENTQPKASVRLYTKCYQKHASPYEYQWQRFAIPVIEMVSKPANDYVDQPLFAGQSEFKSYLFGWGGESWVQPTGGWLGLEPNKGYQVANNTIAGGITYTFHGNLIGNHNGNYDFEANGFSFFGNSYTAPIHVRSLLSQFESQSGFEATINVYDMGNDRFVAMSTSTFNDYDDMPDAFEPGDIQEEIASMQAFIIKGNAGEAANMSYETSIWNPLVNPSNNAPQRRSVSSNRDIVVLNVAANGTKDRIVLRQSDEFSAEFDNSADASKYMNEGTFNIYANTEIGDLAEVSTDELNNTILGFQSAETTEYTLTCSGQKGESFILRDLLTGAEVNLEKGATYTFAQQPNTTNEARFQIVDGRMAPTAVENVQNVKKAEGIYTVLGKYLGAADQLDKLPAGMYIVNGVKIVK